MIATIGAPSRTPVAVPRGTQGAATVMVLTRHFPPWPWAGWESGAGTEVSSDVALSVRPT
jgi:hypothetical protein